MAIASRTQKSAKKFTGYLGSQGCVPPDKDYDDGGNGGKLVQKASVKSSIWCQERFPG